LWQSEPTLQRAALIQGCLFGSFSALWTILALQLDANGHLNAQIAGPFGVVGVLFAPIAGRLADRRVPYTVIRLSAIAMPAVVDDQENLSTR
jgi:MFS family permease